MLNRKMENLMARRSNEESGFTLIELLVVMIIIGILAAIAIPAFMNQQKGARDTATTSDLKNIATNVQSALVQYPDATYFAVADNDDDATTGPAAGVATTAEHAADGKIDLWVGNSATNAERYVVTVSKGTEVSIVQGTETGSFVVTGWNAKGKAYTDAASGRKYDSAAGGLASN